MPPKAIQALMDLLARGEEMRPPPGSLGEFLGFQITEVEPGRVVAESTPGARHTTPRDRRTVGGPILMFLADATTGMACGTAIEEGETAPTLELKINFLRPAHVGSRLRAEARLRKEGGATGFATCEISDAEGRLVAMATATCMRVAVRTASS